MGICFYAFDLPVLLREIQLTTEMVLCENKEGYERASYCLCITEVISYHYWLYALIMYSVYHMFPGSLLCIFEWILAL